jgi:hypothetical protein
MYKSARGLPDDPLSAASAGLLALGIERSRRAETLELLGAMIDLADANGAVLVDGALYSVEQRMGIDACLEAYSWLEQAGVITRTGLGWDIAGFAAHAGPVGETMASIQVLRRHLDSVGRDEPVLTLVADAPSGDKVVALRRWRRAVPAAAVGLAASVAVVAGVAQFVPQAAVTGRNAALHATLPTDVVKGATGPVTHRGLTAVTHAATTATSVPAPTTTAVADNTPTTGLVASVACLGSDIVTTVTNVSLVHLAFAGDHGQAIWAAVVTGTATATNASASIIPSTISVIGHVVGGDTEPVLASLAVPTLLRGVPAPFSAVISLGEAKPTQAVTASASAGRPISCD